MLPMSCLFLLSWPLLLMMVMYVVVTRMMIITMMTKWVMLSCVWAITVVVEYTLQFLNSTGFIADH